MINFEDIFNEDKFTSEALDKKAFVLSSIDKFVPNTMKSLTDCAFVTAKVKTDDIAGIIKLEKAGFFLVDTNLRFEKNISDSPLTADPEVFAATETEREDIVKIAGDAFKFSRFFLDPFIPETNARASRSKWVDNYFTGFRGEQMLAVKANNCVAGFCQLLRRGDNNDEAIIDLIAVSSNFRGRGLASKLIQNISNFMPGINKIIVGTQAANIPAAKVYEKNGFRLASSTYIFHYHGDNKC